MGVFLYIIKIYNRGRNGTAGSSEVLNCTLSFPDTILATFCCPLFRVQFSLNVIANEVKQSSVNNLLGAMKRGTLLRLGLEISLLLRPRIKCGVTGKLKCV